LIDSSTLTELGTYLERSVGGGFTLRVEGGDAFRVSAEGEGWVVDGGGSMDGARMSRAAAGGFVLRDRAGAELGWTSRLNPEDPGAGTSYVLLGDGRLFRIASRGPAETGLELRGWETRGAYLIALPEGAGWRIVATTAGELLPPDRALPILFAAELLDAERPLGGEEPSA